MYLTARFKTFGVPATGLSPTITIYNVTTGAAVISAQPMTEIAGGFYKYDFSAYDSTAEYIFACDGGATLEDQERYLEGSTGIAGDITRILTDIIDGGRIDLLVDAIKAKTDLVPENPATSAEILEVSNNVTSILADSDELQIALTDGGRLDLLLDAIKEKTDLVPGSPATSAEVAAVEAKTDLIQTDVTFLKDIEGGGWALDSETKQMIFYKSDNITEIARFDFFNQNDIASLINVFRRARI
ncbi:MAG: hypothetical protein JEZ11_24685 [Desulfobacterales bacterium]|nr:hypothetical protein [Desulfobacterales bacterium]